MKVILDVLSRVELSYCQLHFFIQLLLIFFMICILAEILLYEYR